MLCRTLTQKNVDNDFRRHHGEATLPNTFFDPTIAPHHPVGTAVVPETFEFQLREFAATPSAHVASSQLSPTTQLRCRKQTCPQKETVGHVCTMHMSTQIHRPWRSLTADKPTRTTTATTTTTTTKKRLPQPNETKRNDNNNDNDNNAATGKPVHYGAYCCSWPLARRLPPIIMATLFIHTTKPAI
mgnify:FL=1